MTCIERPLICSTFAKFLRLGFCFPLFSLGGSCDSRSPPLGVSFAGIVPFRAIRRSFSRFSTRNFWGDGIRRANEILFALRRRGLIPASFSAISCQFVFKFKTGPRTTRLDKVSANGQGVVCSHCRGSVTFNQYIRGRTRQAIVRNSQRRLSKEIRTDSNGCNGEIDNQA
jgi:hypothetical protein